MKLTRIGGTFVLGALLGAVAACGSGSGGSTSTAPPTSITRTLAYVVSECSEDAQYHWTSHQSLRIQHGEGAPITVKGFEFDVGPLLQTTDACSLVGLYRFGSNSVVWGFFQRLGISPDGSTVVFEVTDDFSVQHLPEYGGVSGLLPEEKKGFFSVRADGSGLRRLGPASQEQTYRAAKDPSAPGGWSGWLPPSYSIFSPDGRRVTFTDLGPGPTGEKAIQIFTMDVVSGEREQLTSLPALEPVSPYDPSVFPGVFLDNDTVQFKTYARTDVSTYTVTVKDKLLTKQEPVAIPGSVLVPNFFITGPAGNAFAIGFYSPPGKPPVNQLPHLESVVYELFVAGGANLPQVSEGTLLQLTTFGRSDTALYGALLSPDRQHVLFPASADPFGTNPSENCQIFSIDTLGTNLRQLTFASEGTHSVSGCAYPYPPGCVSAFLGADAATDSVLFHSSCNLLGTNPYGGQLFAMHFDGSGLRQLTDFKGMVTEPDGTVTVELPGPFAVLPPTQ